MAAFIKLVLFLTVFLVIDYCHSDSLIIGNVTGRLVYVDNVKRSSIPMKVRSKSVFYNGDQPIKGISVIDKTSTKAKASVTSGGVGFTSVNIKMKSVRGEALNYQIQIFV